MIANLVVGGLAAGCLYAMVGIAIVIVLNITDIANFAQGEMAMLATFFAYWLMDGVGLPWWQAVSIAHRVRAGAGHRHPAGGDPPADRRSGAFRHHRNARA